MNSDRYDPDDYDNLGAKRNLVKHDDDEVIKTKLPKYSTIVLLAICLILVGINFYYYTDSVKIGIEATGRAFEDTSVNVAADVYDLYFDMAEEIYHVENRVAISIDSVREEALLEVLEVRDVEFVVQDGNSQNSGITSWLEVPGKGVYTIDLKISEFIVDDVRDRVLVRIPKPTLSECTIDYENIVQLLYKNNDFNDSISVGEDQAHNQLLDAEKMIRDEFNSNEYFYMSAEKAARTMLDNLVKILNPDIPDLIVEIEFLN